jgi:hypothetical protein
MGTRFLVELSIIPSKTDFSVDFTHVSISHTSYFGWLIRTGTLRSCKKTNQIKVAFKIIVQKLHLMESLN